MQEVIFFTGAKRITSWSKKMESNSEKNLYLDLWIIGVKSLMIRKIKLDFYYSNEGVSVGICYKNSGNIGLMVFEKMLFEAVWVCFNWFFTTLL